MAGSPPRWGASPSQGAVRCGAPTLALGGDDEGWARASLAVPFARDTLF